MAIKHLEENVVQYSFPTPVMILASGIGTLILSFILFAGFTGFSYEAAGIVGGIIAALVMFICFKKESAGIVLDLSNGTITYAKIPFMFWKTVPTAVIDLKQVSKVFIQNERNTTVSRNGDVSTTRWYHLTLQGKFGSKKFRFIKQDDRDNLYTLLTSK